MSKKKRDDFEIMHLQGQLEALYRLMIQLQREVYALESKLEREKAKGEGSK